MKRRLFLTGDMGIGKSTAIARAVGDKLPCFGGFLTRRLVDGDGRIQGFSLASPDGRRQEVFLDFSSGKPAVHMEVFEDLGVSLLEGDILLLDEIGGFELTSPVFRRALTAALDRDIPILGVLKAPGPANTLMHALGLAEDYLQAVKWLRARLEGDEDTVVYVCDRFDEAACRLAQEWVGAFAPGKEALR